MQSFRRLAARSIERALVESLETRRHLDATYHPLASGEFFQDWSNASQIVFDDDWSGVPSIIGYQGAIEGPNSPGRDPQLLLQPLDQVVDVFANRPDPNIFTSGGVAEFDQLPNPVVAFQGSGTADAPHLVLHVNTTGVAFPRISYLLRDVDTNADNAIQRVALQYRIGTTGDFVNVPEAFVADASAGPNLGLETPVSVALPAATGNQPQLQIRIMTTDAGGSDEWIGVDDIRVFAEAASPGELGFAATSATFNEADGVVSIAVTRAGGASGAVSVNYDMVSGTATAGVDASASGVLNFADGQTSASFDLTINEDLLAEGVETFTIVLSSPTGGATLGPASVLAVTLTDNDTVAPTGVLLNEISSNPPGADQPWEYAEVIGGAGAALRDVYFVSIEGDGGGAGLADLVVSLNDFAIGSNGLLVIKAPDGQGHAIPSETTLVALQNFVNGSTLENDSNSFALIYSPIPIAQATDLDTNNDGTFDNLPAGAQVLDAVGWQTGAGEGVAYGAKLVLQTTITPAAATRIVGNTTPTSVDAWYAGTIVDDGVNGAGSLGYSEINITANAPAGAVLTPGAANFSGAVVLKGDMNNDGAVNNLDIAPFVLGLTNVQAFIDQFGYNPAERGDVNNDGAFNNLDIAPFVALLTGGRQTAVAPAPSPAPTSPTRSPVRPVSSPVSDVLSGGERTTGGLFGESPLKAR